MTRSITLLSFVTILFLGGCSLKPELNVPQMEQPKSTQEALHVNKEWWKQFNDAKLNALVDEALLGSDDLKLSALKVLKARQTYGLNTANELPTLNANASNTRQKTSDEAYSTKNKGAEYSDFAMSGTLSYEIDFWGRLSNQSESSWSLYLATQAARETVRNTLIHDVISAYFNLASLQARMRVLEQTAQAYKENYEFRSKQQKAGTISDVLANQALAQYNNAKASQNSLMESFALQKSALAILVGKSPQALFEDSKLEATLPSALVIPQGVPSTLMENRPDIKESLENLKSKNALIGVEKAAYFPTISLTGSYGQQSDDLGNILKSSANRWSLGPSLSVPIFDFGRIKQRVSISETDLQSSLVSYEQTVKKAYKEVHDALAKENLAQSRLVFQQEELKAYQKVLDLSTKRFNQGVANQLEVLDAQKGVLSSTLSVIATQQALLTDQAELFKALGGGWNEAELLHVN
ncbi:efflux transporter outer membrane subunit [Sulfurospirillum multivorans]|uniref:RND efflux system, outer membrane lipoprotein CmeC n=2 Tax=Sulfurospirillum multivorans TaxID=66821 RepID=A0AA86AKV1_SULMK|nr:TolC family protein [Sulfurospirillum multivorans]AHJ12094.1 RND efflux system, outer membrane lipoprotein CmeC [Sulfurospirillum multivorans DSM 12446]QEH05595.1 RND efflux system, outer membrane lipoprotein CmeC [Sulfurospirillum multivorans]